MSHVWIMPPESVVLATDGRQLWYANPDGTGTCTPIGYVDYNPWTLELEEDEQ